MKKVAKKSRSVKFDHPEVEAKSTGPVEFGQPVCRTWWGIG
jgi:hypothetical protein